MAIFGRFFMKNGNFWCIHMLQIVFLSSIYASPTCFFASSTLKIGGGVFSCLSQAENSIFDQKTAFFGRFFMEKWQFVVHTDAVNCVSVISMSLQSAFFASSTLGTGEGVFNCLSEAKKITI